MSSHLVGCNLTLLSLGAWPAFHNNSPVEDLSMQCTDRRQPDTWVGLGCRWRCKTVILQFSFSRTITGLTEDSVSPMMTLCCDHPRRIYVSNRITRPVLIAWFASNRSNTISRFIPCSLAAVWRQSWLNFYDLHTKKLVSGQAEKGSHSTSLMLTQT